MTTSKTAWALMAGVILSLYLPRDSLAHWCSNIYQTYARIVVKPERQNINVAVGETGELRVRVRNNFPYTLRYIKLRANNPAGLTITVTPGESDAEKRPVYAGQETSFVLSIQRTATGADDVTALNLQISTSVENVGPKWRGWSGSKQDDDWVIDDANLDPQKVRDHDPQQSQSLDSYKLTELADVGCAACESQGMQGWQGHEGLLQLYSALAGMGNPHGTDGHQSLRAGQALAIRLRFDDFTTPDRASTVAAMLSVAKSTTKNEFSRGLAAFYAAYGGNDAGVKEAIQALASADASSNTQLMAKAALLLLGDSTNNADIAACSQNSSLPSETRSVCAAALGMIDQDQPITDTLIPSAPIGTNLENRGGYQALVASYLLELVALERRGGPTGSEAITFFGDTGDPGTTPTSDGGCGCTSDLSRPMEFFLGIGMLLLSWRCRRFDKLTIFGRK